MGIKEKLRALYPPFLRIWSQEKEPVVRCTEPLEMGEGVIDKATFSAIEGECLFEALNEGNTLVGQATLYRSLVQPLVDEELIQQKQGALRELETQEALARGCTELVQEAAKWEEYFYQLLYGTFLGFLGGPTHKMEAEGFGYTTYRGGTRFIVEMVEKAQQLPTPENPYLQAIVADLREFTKSRAYALMKGPVYRTDRAIQTKAEGRWWVPRVRFRPSLLKPVLIPMLGLGIVAVFALMAWIDLSLPYFLDMTMPALTVLFTFLVPLLFMAYIPMVGTFDRDSFIYPLRIIYRRSEAVHEALDALGRLDELLAFREFANRFEWGAVLPQLRTSEQHRIRVRQVKHPVLAKDNPAYVGNDIDTWEARLVLITGPNSGGKTAFCQALAQCQLLAQIGCYLPAEEAEVVAAERIACQVPEASHIADQEGRFGAELKWTRQIFLHTVPRALVILDELAEGTTPEERLQIGLTIMDGFYRKGNTTLLITHNHELVDRLLEQRSQCLTRQVEFVDDVPTYRLIEGIARYSHAHRVAKQVGLAQEDIERYLTQEDPPGRSQSSSGEQEGGKS